ncbi:sigma-70 family RNA polymerase sigma factor [Vulgatibacter incomptus]|uniref:RNA polymerase sigma factor RpoE n=1 Tax=Vulgatibacter incomptus TaxID=1391653 RepID=A0A0K1PJ07_9BACT|nr:sigma-70 family RNA polymerase sigma factor [Vulgatibacter incomptus]AKU93089.1 RNA polymerase sigma factor RpoE [Vulgatibacter incomptus]
MELDDLALVRRYQEGDQRAFKLLVEKYQRKVYAVANAMVKDREEALDISQEAFVKVHRNLAHFKGESSFYTWLYRITRNLAIDKLRAKRNEAVAFDDALGTEDRAEPGFIASALGSNPQKTALRRELAEKLNHALSQLPEKHREILVLREVEGMSYEDLAETLEIPKGTVMSRLFHARSKMQKLLEDYLGEDRMALASGEDEG